MPRTSIINCADSIGSPCLFVQLSLQRVFLFVEENSRGFGNGGDETNFYFLYLEWENQFRIKMNHFDAVNNLNHTYDCDCN